jgi:hypothetical protein
MKKIFRIIFILIIGTNMLAACQPAAEPATSTPSPIPTPTEKPALWQTVAELPAPTLMKLTGFNDATFGVSIGDDSQAVYTTDGGANWQHSKIGAFELFGLDIVDRTVAWTCGNRAVRITTDGARTWQAGSDFGDAIPNNCRFLSFLDAKTGWVATSTTLAATSDGAATWTEPSLPEGIGQIAAISLFAPGRGCLLATSGALYCTPDDGKTWNQAGAPPLGDLTIANMNSPVAAMRFKDSNHGIIVIPAVAGGVSRVVAFHTSDGGAGWTQETVATTFGFPVISHDGRMLTLFCLPNRILVLQYNG